MGRKSKASSPTLVINLKPEHYDKAVKSRSGACLIADEIKRAYPQYSNVSVDMATIRVSDRAEGVRFTYLTPPSAQHILLAFDQGWKNPVESLVVKRAVMITPITRPRDGSPYRKARAEDRAERLADLEAKEAGGDLNVVERRALTRMRNNPPPPQRPTGPGPATIHRDREHRVVVVGGPPMRVGPDHPNLLRGTDRHFGAKLADPGEVFNDAVEAAVAERLAGRE